MMRLERITLGDIDEIVKELADEGRLFTLPAAGLAKAFLARFFAPEKIWQLDFDRVRERYIELAGSSCPLKEVPDDERHFTSEILKHYLHLSTAPSEELERLYAEASKDLAAILENVEYCHEQLKGIDPESESADYDRKFFDYYLKENQSAQQEIVEFLASGIRWEAYRAAQRKDRAFLAIDMFRVPYSFRWPWSRQNYDPREFSEVRNKFGQLGISKIDEVERLWEEDREEFDRYLEAYIDQFKILDATRHLAREHHRLHARYDDLEDALEVYESGRYRLFCRVVPLEIEGAFREYCLELGLTARAIQKESLSGKLNRLKERSYIPHFAYFAFKFPVLRNRVAHGHLIHEAPERTARLLLLDLHDVYERVASPNLPANRVAKFMREVEPADAGFDDLARFAGVDQDAVSEVIAFHGLEGKVEALSRRLSEPGFWEYLETCAADEWINEACAAGIKRIAIGLKREHPGEAVKVLKALGSGRGDGTFDLVEFFDHLPTPQR